MIGRPLNRLTNRPNNRLHNRLANRPNNRLHNRLANRSNNRLHNRFVSVNQTIRQEKKEKNKVPNPSIPVNSKNPVKNPS